VIKIRTKCGDEVTVAQLGLKHYEWKSVLVILSPLNQVACCHQAQWYCTKWRNLVLWALVCSTTTIHRITLYLPVLKDGILCTFNCAGIMEHTHISRAFHSVSFM